MNGWKRKKPIFGQPSYINSHAEALRVCLGQLVPGLVSVLSKRKQSAPRDELAELTGMPAGHKDAPDDPGLARLLPDFEQAGDEEYEGDNSLLRSLHEADIIDAKVANLEVLGTSLAGRGSSITINPDQAKAWVIALTDIRLYLLTGNHEGVQDVADFLGWVLEGLLEVMMEDAE